MIVIYIFGSVSCSFKRESYSYFAISFMLVISIMPTCIEHVRCALYEI